MQEISLPPQPRKHLWDETEFSLLSVMRGFGTIPRSFMWVSETVVETHLLHVGLIGQDFLGLKKEKDTR